MGNHNFFRTGFRGFNKRDVLEHIDALHERQQDQLAEMQTQVDLANKRSEEARAEADAVIALPVQQLAELEHLRERVPTLERELADMRLRVSQQEMEVSMLAAQNADLADQLAKASAFSDDIAQLSAQWLSRMEEYRKTRSTASTEE